MIIKDEYGTRITLQQAKNGKIIIPIGTTHITLSKGDAERFTLYDIEGFDVDLYRKAYQQCAKEIAKDQRHACAEAVLKFGEIGERATVESIHSVVMNTHINKEG